MDPFGLLGVLTYSAVGLVVGLRLLRLARRTGEWPERLIGGAFLSGFQYLYSTIRMAMTGQASISGFAAALVSSLGLIAAGTILLAFFPPRSYLLWLERRSEGAPA